VYYHTITFYNKIVTVTSLYWKLCYIALIAISTSKIIIVVLFHKLIQMFSTGSTLLGSDICCKVLNLGLWKLWTRNWSHHMPTTKSTPFVVSKDEWDTKEDPGKSMRMHCIYSGMAKGWSDVEHQKIQARSFNHGWITQVWRHQG